MGAVVKIFVGEGKTYFQVHRDLLCEASSFFNAAFVGPAEFKETSEQSISLPEDDADTFEVLVKWLYGKRLSDPEPRRSWEVNYHYLARLDVLADKYDIAGIRNEIIDAVFECEAKKTDPFSEETVAFVYANSTSSSSLRKLSAGAFAWHIDMEYYLDEKTSSWLHEQPDFAVDLAIALGRRQCAGEVSPFRRKREEFYYKSGDWPEDEKSGPKLA